jgi:DNA-binding transcriptional LysR family regulator
MSGQTRPRAIPNNARFVRPGHRGMPPGGLFPNAVQKDVWLMQTIVGLVAGGTGVALVPASLQNLRRRGVVYKSVYGLSPTVELGLIWRREHTNTVLNSFLRVARESPWNEAIEEIPQR